MGKKVLIVEDDSNIAELLHLYLEKEGFETAVAGDGGKGVELFRSFRPDLVLLDIMLPVMDGWSVLKKIRENDKHPRHHAHRQGRDPGQGGRSWRGTADDYIVKPFEMKEVLARIHAVSAPLGGTRTAMGEEAVLRQAGHQPGLLRTAGGRQAGRYAPKELELLFHLAASPNRVFTRNQLLDECGL